MGRTSTPTGYPRVGALVLHLHSRGKEKAGTLHTRTSTAYHDTGPGWPTGSRWWACAIPEQY
eukprot:739710-Pyramimonas_sp.AAC.1